MGDSIQQFPPNQYTCKYTELDFAPNFLGWNRGSQSVIYESFACSSEVNIRLTDCKDKPKSERTLQTPTT